MGEISESLFDSMKILYDQAIKTQQSVKILNCKVIDLVDSSVGLYNVEYLGQKLSAYSNNISVKYSKDDEVYVISKDGTLSETLIIIGSVTPYTGLYNSADSEAEYIKTADSIFTSVNEGNVINFCTYQSPQEQQIPIVLGMKFSSVFKSYIDDYGLFCFSAKFKTDIKDLYQRVNGDYGLVLSIPLVKVNENGATEYISKELELNISKFLGDPYNLQEYTEQKFYINFKEEATGYSYDTTKSPSLVAYCKDFKYNSEITTPDIFIDEVQFFPVDVVGTDDLSGYYLSLTASEGNYFMQDRTSSSKIITPTLFVSGSKVDTTGLDYYWFVEDASVTATSEYYTSTGGIGWRCLNTYSSQESIDGTIENLLDLSQNTLRVEKTSVKTSIKYKCIIMYNNTAVRQIITLTNLDSKTKIKLAIEGSNIITSNSEVKLNCIITLVDNEAINNHAAFKYVLQRYDKNNNYIDNNFYNTEVLNDFSTIDETTHQYLSTFSFPANIMEDSANIFLCTVYLQDEGVEMLYGTDRLALAVASGSNYYLSMLNGDKIYKYDSDGDSPRTADYDGPPSSRISDGIEPVSFKIYKSDGSELTDIEYKYCKVRYSLPKNTMLKYPELDLFKNDNSITFTEDDNYYYLSKQGRFSIAYDIADNFNPKKRNNTILVEVNVDKDNIVNGNANLQFLKEGESGTNGTKFSTILKYNNYGYGVINTLGIPNKLQLVYVVDEKKWYVKDCNDNLAKDLKLFPDAGLASANNGPTLQVEVYEDGSIVKDPSRYSVLEWTMFDEQATKPYFKLDTNGILQLNKDIRNEAEYDKDGVLISPEQLMYEWFYRDEVRVAIIQAKIQVTNTSGESFNQNMYAHYPIELTRVETLKDLQLIPTINGGFSSVLYATDGTNPQYDNSTEFVFSSGVNAEGVQTYSSTEWSSSDNIELRKVEDMENTYRAKPKPKYDNGMANNYVKVEVAAAHSEEIQKGAEEQDEYYEKQVSDTERKIRNLEAERDSLFAIGAVLKDTPITSLTVDNVNIMSKREIGLNKLKQAKVALDAFYKYFTSDYGYVYQGVITVDDYDYQSIYDNCSKYADKAIDKLYSLIGNGSLSFLIPLYEASTETDGKNVLIELDDDSRANLRSILNKNKSCDAYGGLAQLDKFISQYNTAISDYYKEYQALTKQNDKGEYIFQKDVDKIQLFYKVIYNIINTPSQLEENSTKTALEVLIDLKSDRYSNWFSEFSKLFQYFSTSNNTIYTLGQFKNNIVIPLFDNLKLYYAVYSDVKKGSYVEFDDNGNIKLSLVIINSVINELESLLEKFPEYQKDRDASGAVLDAIKKGITLIHVKPIIFKLNTYESSYLNDWDGNKLYLNEDEDYLLAPMLGAGRKNDDNTFTGLTMGIKKFGKQEGKSQIGLFGYAKGKQSIFLDAETGRAEFGVSGSGQINLDPATNKALLFSGNYFDRKEDGTIDYTKTTGQGMLIDLTTPEIRFGSGGFVVGPNGKLEVGGTGEEIDGQMAGWYIGEYEFYSKNNRLHMVSADPLRAKDLNGYFYSNNHKELINTENGFYLGTDGFSINNVFRIEGNSALIGNLKTDKYWKITGDSNFGYISYNADKILNYTPPIVPTENGIYDTEAKSVYIGTDGISVGRCFKVDENGYAYLGDIGKKHWSIISAQSGDTYMSYNCSKILNYSTSIDEFGNITDIYSNNKEKSVYLGTDGISVGYKFKVTDEGKVEIGDIGKAHWTIDTKGSTSYIVFDEKNDDSKYDLGKPENITGGYKSVYLGTDGIRIGHFLLAEHSTSLSNEQVRKGSLYLGDLDSDYHWTITHGNYETQKIDEQGKLITEVHGTSYLAYNADKILKYEPKIENGIETMVYTTGEKSVYLGTNGISIGHKFKVDDDGKLELGDVGAEHWIVDTNNRKSYIAYDSNKSNYTLGSIGRLNGYGEKSIYLGVDGFRIGHFLLADYDDSNKDKKGHLYLGNLDNDYHWTITNGTYEHIDTETGETVSRENSSITYNCKKILSYSKTSGYNNDEKSVYLGTNGISIGHKFKVDDDGTMELGDIGAEHWTIDTKEQGSYISFNATSISKYYSATPEKPEEYKNPDESVYFGTDGLSIGNFFKVVRKGTTIDEEGKRINQDAEMYIGDIGGKHWTIKSDGKTRSYISHGTNKFEKATSEGKAASKVYLGTDGISLGEKFSVNDKGQLICMDGTFYGEINASSGTIGGWTIGENKLYSEQTNSHSIQLITGQDGGLLVSTTRKSLGNNADMSREIKFSGNGNEDHIKTPAFQLYAHAGDIFCRSGVNSVININWHKSSESDTDNTGNHGVLLPNPVKIGVYSTAAAGWGPKIDPLGSYNTTSTTRFWGDGNIPDTKPIYGDKPTKDDTISLYQYIRWVIYKELGAPSDLTNTNTLIKDYLTKNNYITKDSTTLTGYYTKTEIDNKYATKTSVTTLRKDVNGAQVKDNAGTVIGKVIL